MNRVLDIRIHDATLSLWQDDAQDPSFRTEVYGGLIRFMRDRGWSIGRDRRVHTHHRILSADNRMAAKGELRASIRVGGRVVELAVWAETWDKVNRNGHRFDYDKRKRMGFLTRLRVELEFRKIVTWAGAFASVTVSDSNREQRGPQTGGLTALEWIAREYATSRHLDKALGRPVCRDSYNKRSADQQVVEHGATVWFADEKGRLNRGTAYYSLNSMWHVVTNRWEVKHLSCSQLYCSCPADLRRKRNERQRRARLEREMSLAIAAMNFERAALVRDLLFGKAPTFLIWSSKNNAFYGSNCSGYTTDRVSAGRYTRAEAAREVGRVPHLLTAVDGAGRHLRASEIQDLRA